MSLALADAPRLHSSFGQARGVRRAGRAAGLGTVGFLVMFWTLLPIYNILLIAFSDDPEEFDGTIWFDNVSFEGFQMIWSGGHRYLAHFWLQFGNSIIIGFATMIFTVVIGVLASFAIGRMGLRRGPLIGNASLLTYAIPSAFLVIPFARLISIYGLTDTLTAVVATQVTFALPYAVLILHRYGHLIPIELDDAARVDGATPFQVFLYVYIPLMAPALAAVATFAMLLAWNDYLYQFVLLYSEQKMTVAAAISQFFDADEAPWSYLMSVTVVFSLPPIAVYYALRRYMVAGLTMGGIKS